MLASLWTFPTRLYRPFGEAGQLFVIPDYLSVNPSDLSWNLGDHLLNAGDLWLNPDVLWVDPKVSSKSALGESR